MVATSTAVAAQRRAAAERYLTPTASDPHGARLVARQEGTLQGGGIVIPKKAHQELAEMAGCSRETVTRALGTLKRKQCVSWSGQTMRLEIEPLQRYVRTRLQVSGA